MMKLTTLFAVSVSLILSGFCSLGVQAHPVQEDSSRDPVPAGAYYTDNYRNLFNEYLGISQQQTDQKMEQIWNHFFVNEKTKVYYESDDNTAYIYDTGNQDVRTEGMSYGMMICVQLDKQAEFDKLWRWAKKYMLYTSGKWSGYYAWHCTPRGVKIGKEPSCASDGEIYFITSLFFASHRWGNDGAYDYNQEAQKILKDVMSKDGSQGVYNLFNTESKLVTFVPEKVYYNYTDPSYNDIRLNEFYMLDAENNILYPKGHYPERTEVRFKTIFDFKFAYAHEVWPKPDGSRILVNYVRTRRFRIYDLSARLLHDVCLDYASNKYVVDAKSILGIFSIDLSQPVLLRIHAEGEKKDCILNEIQKYLIQE